MASKYRKIDPRLWKDEKFRNFSAQEKLFCIYMFTAQANRIGIFSFSPGEAAEDLETLPQTFLKGFGNVINTLNWRWDSGVRVLYIPTWFKYNAPENPNVLKGVLDDLQDVPETLLLSEFYGNLRYLDETLHETFLKRLPKRIAKPIGKQEQEQEQEEEPPKAPLSGGVVYSPDFEVFWAAYPKHTGKGAACRAWNRLRPDQAAREKILAAILDQRKTAAWQKDNGQFIPNPATWLNQRRFDDDIASPAPVAAAARVWQTKDYL